MLRFVLEQVVDDPVRGGVVVGQPARSMEVVGGHRPQAVEKVGPDRGQPLEVLGQRLAVDLDEPARAVPILEGQQRR